VVVNDLNFIRVGLSPLETDSPLIIDSDAVLTGSIASQALEPVPGRNPQIGETLCVVQHPQLSPRRLLDFTGESPGDLTSPDLFCQLAFEGSDHQKPL
jgi:hypothetical protein